MPSGIYPRIKKSYKIIPREIRKCLICDKEFEVSIHSTKRHCSRLCGYTSMGETHANLKEVRKCLKCNKEVLVSINSNQRFCSKNCSTSYTTKGRIPWNAGTEIYYTKNCLQCGKEFKTKNSPERSKYCSKKCQNKANGPRMLRLWTNPVYSSKVLEKFHKMGQRLFRKDLGFSVRSPYEANICRILKFTNIPFGYETKRFRLSNGKIYIPDVYLPIQDIILEMKPGRSCDLSKAKLLKKDNPKLNIKFIDQESYRKLEKKFNSRIPDWEFIRLFKEDKNACKI